MKKASVIITTKNRREDLLKAVESAMGQRGLMEVIVIDDGSTDGTEAAVSEMLKKDLTTESTENTIEHRGRCEMEQPKVGPRGEGAGATESKEQAGLRLTGQAGASEPDSLASKLTESTVSKSLIRSADGPASETATCNSPRATAASPLPVLRLIRHEVSAGYIVRRNEAARLARGDVIFSLDDDAVFSSPLVVEQTLRDFSHPRIGAVAIPYIEPHKANTEMQRAPTREDVWITASYIGTAHAVRRDVFLALGGYREHLVHQGEEGDFCIRMLAAKPPMADSGNAEKLKREGTTDASDKHGWGGAGERLVKPSGAAFSNPSTSELARDSENTSLTHSASGPASLPAISYPLRATAPTGAPATSHSLPATASPCDATPATSHSLPVTAPEVPGFFVRLGNSDPIIHNESPKRDYSRMDFYGRRNDVLFHWQNTPMPDLLWQLPMTIVGGLLCAYRVKRWRKMLEGIGAGFLAIWDGLERDPVSRSIAREFKLLKQAKRKLSK
jgi:glycosyltransferase involved in cell wall biosynthesis